MGSPFFHEFKKQASFFFKEKIKTARLALTDVTPAQSLTEEATDGNPWAPDTRTLKIISRAAFEVDDYWRIVEILHKRLARFDRKNWRFSYNALIVLEHLSTHGPESVAEEFNWGLNVRKKSERVLKLLEKGPLLKEERDRSRKLTRGIEGFGSFCQRTSILRESSLGTFGRCNSQFNDHGNEENQFLPMNYEDSTKTEAKRSDETLENSKPWNCFPDGEVIENSGARTSFKENVAPKKELNFHEWNGTGELNSLLGDEKDDPSVAGEEDHHPFNDTEHQATVSLLSTTDQLLEAC
ncbi:ENTH/VHS family protein [Actinidia rufa]|uniref:ENTH/VHS family protein n=1 Tax=Actinidia rufa TaxID=165716 RepID=A0A7J0H4Q8_9ERIC|nr:ENTH/VHS family protein [Actinidia rufa]